MELGLEPIQKNWKLDSIEFIDYGNHSIIEREEIPEWKLKFEDEKLFCQYWSSNERQNEIAHHSEKRTFFIKSFWLWKNKIIGESDTYNKSISKLEYAELLSSYDFENNTWFNRLDTLETADKVKRDLKISDSLSQLGMWQCGTGMFDFEIDTIGITKKETDRILRDWKLK